jgi:hypothetical protein
MVIPKQIKIIESEKEIKYYKEVNPIYFSKITGIISYQTK